MANIKKSDNSKYSRWCRSTGTLEKSLWECKMVQSLWKTVWWFLIKLNIHLPYGPAIPFLGSFPSNMKTYSRKKQIFITNVYGSFIHYHQKLVTTQIHLNWGMDAPTVIYPYDRILINNLKKLITRASTTGMTLKCTRISGRSQTQMAT